MKQLPFFFLILIIFLAPTIIVFLPIVSNATAYTSHLSSSRADSDYVFSVSCENNSHTTNGGDPTGYYIKIENTGKLQDTISLEYEIINVSGGPDPKLEDWYANLEKSQVTLDPTESAVIILTIASSCTCQEGSIAHVRVTGTSANAPVMTDYTDTYTKYGPSGELIDLEKPNMLLFSDLVPGQYLNFSLTVFNLQSITQSYIFSSPIKPSGWNLEFIKESFEIGPSGLKEIEVRTKVPLKNNPGWFNITFNVQSDRDSAIFDTVVVPIELLPELQIKSIEVTPSGTSVQPGEQVKIKVTIKNAGGAAAYDIDLKMYNNVNKTNQNLIGETQIDTLFGKENTTHTFSWVPQSEMKYDLVAHVNPSLIIQEVGSRYYNNIKSEDLVVAKQSDGDGGDPDGNGSDGGSDGNGSKETDGNDFMLILAGGVGAFVFIIIIVIVIMKVRGGPGEDEKTATKIPISDGRVGRPSYTRSGTKTIRGKQKTAHKVRLSESKGRSSGRRQRGNR